MALDRASGDFGSRLRAARERRGMSLRQIAGATKISVSALEALERNDVSRLPGGIFSRAFVRSYASEVGLDPDEAIHEFLAEFPKDATIPVQAPAEVLDDNDAIESERRVASTFLRLIGVSLPIAAAVVYFATSGRTPSPLHPAPGVDAPPAAAVAAAPTTPANSEPIATARPPAPPPVRPAATAAVSPPPRAASAEGKSDEISRLTVELSVTRPCWLSATVDGEKKIERLFQAGERQTIEITRELSFTAGDASAVRMAINGVAARSLGKEGEVVTARVNLTNFKSYLPSR